MLACHDHTISFGKVKAVYLELFIFFIDNAFPRALLKHSLEVPHVDIAAFADSCEEIVLIVSLDEGDFFLMILGHIHLPFPSEVFRIAEQISLGS